ncbi:MAG: hypothetical protein IT440_00160 [Phycisphaeraceae bacterium]|nr:hypothetical protein [Phycisphaeraceae bacterium]
MVDGTVNTETSNDTSTRINRVFGPVVAGMIIDVVDLLTFGSFGLVAGIPVGAFAGYWLGQSLGLSRRSRLLCALAAAVYCTVPFTEFVPLGTLVGAYARYMQDRSAPPDAPMPEPLDLNRAEQEQPRAKTM